ncbi:MAG: asparaginase [Pseudomonadota bacterium]
MDVNPELIVATRGAHVESCHRGAIAVANPDAGLLIAIGDVSRPVFPRSAIKAIQALPLIQSGAADSFGLTDRELAVACASHSGSPDHVTTVQRLITRLNLDAEDLVCGAHWPQTDDDRHALAAAGQQPTRLHNNCSGKHAGLLALAKHIGAPTQAYWTADHPVQHRVREALADLSGCDLTDVPPGLDGCSLPTWPLPIAGLARAFAIPAAGARHDPSVAQAMARLRQACWAEPAMVAGPSRLDTEVLEAGRDRVFVKTGAEGVYCGTLLPQGFGFAIKIDDGTTRAAEMAMLQLICLFDDRFRTVRDRRAVIRNWSGVSVGRLQATADLVEHLHPLTAYAR